MVQKTAMILHSLFFPLALTVEIWVQGLLWNSTTGSSSDHENQKSAVSKTRLHVVSSF